MPKRQSKLKKFIDIQLKKRPKFSKVQMGMFALPFVAIGVFVLLSSRAAGVTANLFVVPTNSAQGSASCIRSASPVDFTTALANNNVCKAGNGVAGFTEASAYDNACKASQSGSGGTIIGVKAGQYSVPQPSNGFLMGAGQFSCGQSGASDYDPNSAEAGTTAGTRIGWATFQCADGETPSTVTVDPYGSLFVYSNFHARFYGGCFDFGPVRIGQGGAAADRRVQNLQFDAPAGETIKMGKIDIAGAKNTWINNVNVGPAVVCGKNTSPVPDAARCNAPTVWLPAFEAKYENNGNATGCGSGGTCGGSSSQVTDSAGFESYIHGGDSSPPSGVRVSNTIFVDHQSKDIADIMGHPGCMLMSDENNWTFPSVVFDNIHCEREAVQNFQVSSGGVIIQNSTFGCPVYKVIQSQSAGNRWGSCVSGKGSINLGYQPGNCSTQSNILIRYNVFLAHNAAGSIDTGGASCNSYSNIRAIGNVFASSPQCFTGISYSYNAFYNGAGAACATNSTTLGGDPFIDSDANDAANTNRGTSHVNLHLNGNFTMSTVPNNGTDFFLDHDADGSTRTYPTKAGAYISSSSTPGIPTVSLSASPTSVSSGSASTLTWSSTNATSCTTSGAWTGSKATSGTQSTGNLTTTSTYTLTCTGTGGSANASATVTVGAAIQDPAFDDFERASLGGNWQQNIGSGGIINNSDLGILSGSISINSWVGSTFSNNQFSQAQISTNASSEMQKQVFVRRRSSDAARYAFHYNIESSPLRWEIKYDGVPTAQTKLLATNSTAPAPVPGDTLRIEAEGDNIRGYHNGNLVLSATDSSAEKITSGPPGLTFRLIGNANVSQPEPVFENWSGGSLGGSSADTTPPTVSVTSPTNGSTVCGSINVAASASDNVGVVGVQFKVGGTNFGAEDTSAPYSIPLDTTTIPNGTHSLSAAARDAAGNQTTSAILMATFNNPCTPTQKQGDLNNDGFVNILDLSILLSNYGKAATPSQGDINGDGFCTILDLSILLSKYGT